MKKKEKPQWSSLAIILAAVCGAMILPLAMMGYSFLQEVRHRDVSKGAQAVAESLRQSLEATADRQWEGSASLSTQLEMFALDPQAEGRRLRELADKLGGDTVYEEPREDGGLRLLVRVPQKHEGTLRTQILGGEATLPGSDSDVLQIVEIIIKKREP